MAEYNLKIVNEILENGLWGGYTRVIEAGSRLALESNHAIYAKYHTLVGGIINFFLSLDANIFIGTEVSSYSTSVVNSRFYRNDNYSDGGMKGEQKKKLDYFYSPEGLYAKESIHWFRC